MVHIKKQNIGLNRQTDTDPLPDIYLHLLQSLPTSLNSLSYVIFITISLVKRIVFNYQILALYLRVLLRPV